MSTLPIDLTKLTEVPFEPEKEPWNEYELEDGSILRFRIIVIKFFDTGQIDPLTGCPSYVVAHQNILSVISPERGAPLAPPADLAKIPDDKKEEVKITKKMKEDWNVYIVDKKYRYEVKPIITAVYKLKGYFDPAGYPVYYVKSQTINRTEKLKSE